MKRIQLIQRFFFFFGLFVFPLNSFAAERAAFYQGKTLNFIINFAAGGPTDIEGRVLAKHW